MSEQKEAWPPEGVRCETCAYSGSDDPKYGPDVLSCRKTIPAVAFEGGSRTGSGFPPVSTTFWCGEWRARTGRIFGAELDQIRFEEELRRRMFPHSEASESQPS